MGHGNMGNMGKMMKQIQQMQQQMEETQKEIERRTVEATAGGGVVRATVSGGLDLVELEIDPDVVDPEDVDMLRDLIIAAVNEAMRSAQDMAREELGKVTGGLDLPNIPGLMN